MKKIITKAAALLLALAVLGGCTNINQNGNSGLQSNPDFSVYCFSAGKADAFLLYTESSAVLIDCGEKGFGKEILGKLEELGIEKLDYLIITHFDKDHVGGAARVINNISIDNVIVSNCPKDSEEYEKYEKALENAGLSANVLSNSLAFTLDGVSYTIYPPAKSDYKSNGSNNSSLIIAVQNGDNSFLFTGDAQDERIKEFVAANKTTFDVLKCPYHGHWQESLPLLLESVKPSYVIISSSDDEPEDSETLDLIASAGAKSLLTREGSLLIQSDGNEIKISRP